MYRANMMSPFYNLPSPPFAPCGCSMLKGRVHLVHHAAPQGQALRNQDPQDPQEFQAFCQRKAVVFLWRTRGKNPRETIDFSHGTK